MTLGGKGARPDLILLGGWRWALFGYCLLVFLLSVALPYLFLLMASLTKTWALGPTAANFTLDN